MEEDKTIKTFTIDISKLVPGLVLAENIIHDKTGAVLIPAKTMIDNHYLKHLKTFSTSGECVVYDPKYINQNLLDTIEDCAKIKIKNIPQSINKQSKTIYLETFETMSKFIKKDKSMDDAAVKEIMGAAANISDEIIRDPYVLPQIAVLKAIDNYTFSHSLNVAIYATTLARFLDYKTGVLKEICLAGLMHDIGKLDIPKQIVDKPGLLTQEEFAIMKKHAWYSAERLKNIRSISGNIIAAVSQHHEKVNGTGYNLGLRDTQIHDWASILAIADVYDALTTVRAYRMALLPHEGAEIVMASAIGHLDFDKVKVFVGEMPFYPVGTRVALSTGKTGCVISRLSKSPLRPVIQTDENSAQVVDLSHDLTTFITSIIN